MSKYLGEEGLIHLWQKMKNKFVTKVAGKGLSTNDFTDAYKDMLDNLDNTECAFTAEYQQKLDALYADKADAEFSVTQNAYIGLTEVTANSTTLTVEYGTDVTSLAVVVSANKVPTAAAIKAGSGSYENYAGTLGSRIVWERTNANGFGATTFTVKGTYTLPSGTTKDVTQSVSLAFSHRVYSGASASETFSATVAENLTYTLETAKKNVTATAGANQYLYYCVPHTFGVTSVKISTDIGAGGMTNLGTATLNGETYDIWRSVRTNLGSTTLEVS